MKHNKTDYSIFHIFIHWIMAVAIFFLFASGLYMMTLDYYDPGYTIWPRWHKEIGFSVLILLIIRVTYLFIAKKPKPLASHARWEVILAHATHALMYFFLFVITGTGYFIATARGSNIDFFGLFDIPALLNADEAAVKLGRAHLFAAYALITLVLLHALGALKHAVIDHDGTLKRMWFFGRKKDQIS